MTFRKQLLAERERLNLTQTQAAKALGIGLRTVAAWETTDTPPMLTQIGALAVLRAIPSPVDTDTKPTVVQPVETQPKATAYWVDVEDIQFPKQP